MKESTPPRRLRRVNRTAVDIIPAAFFSNVSHEMCTGVLHYALACANAVRDMVSSVRAGYCLEISRTELGFGVAATIGCLGPLRLVVFLQLKRIRPNGSLGPMRIASE